jgi:hypothetical protein
MSLVLCVKFPKRRLELIFKVRSLGILEYDVGVKAEGFVFRNNLHGFEFFLFMPWPLLGVGKYFL